MDGKLILLVFITLFLSLSAPQALLCQTEKQDASSVCRDNDAQPALPAGAGEDETMFYAFLQEDPGLTSGPFFQFLKDKPVMREFVAPHSHLERKFRPMAQWRRWADKPQRFLASLLFICLTGCLVWSVFPSYLQAAAAECKKNFWKSFGSGLLLAIIAMAALRAIFITEIGWPLGIIVAGLSLATMLVGLSLSVFNLGHSMSLLLHLNKIALLCRRPDWARYLDIFIGSIIASLILQIPQIGLMPRCGTRLLALFAILGTGAIYREFRRRRAEN